MTQVAFTVLDAGEHTRIGRRKARDDIVGMGRRLSVDMAES